MAENNEETQAKTRRSALQRELDALGELVRILKPLTSEQRARLSASAAVLLEETADKSADKQPE